MKNPIGIWMALMSCTVLPAATLTSTPATTCHINGAPCIAVAITPHPSWAAPIGGSQWISIAQTGWPIATWLPNDTVVSFSEVFSLASMPSSAAVTFAADDSASLWLNGALVAAEASIVGNMYSTCSDFGVTCRYHTSVDILPWLLVGSNEIRFDVAQRGSWSFGLDYAGSMKWLNDPPLPTPEPGTGWLIGGFVMFLVFFMIAKHIAMNSIREWEMGAKQAARYRLALEDIAATYTDTEGLKRIARMALEE